MMLIGARASILQSSNRYNVGLAGVVTLETQNMIHIRTPRGDRALPKRHSVWSIDGVAVPGEALQGQFHRRIGRA